ncbi:FAD-dependent monooxygenase [Streptomyces sp. N2A]|uniref:FAD-dependent monooxygenase n=1 Tax=Streptomyces sp. N2A TaxID=3073936 RepID=UPI00286FCEAB|nr:FAD-dependent monooxygenase [Streptomyces sp. N2A]
MSKALIIGGGIAGAVTAMALHKAGIEAEVFEAYPTGADDVGAFLVVFANGLEALRVIDAHDPVAAHSFPARRIAVFGHDGSKVGERPIAGSGTGPGPRTLRRATLYQVLHAEAARRGIPVHHGKRLVGAETVASAGGRRVVAAFADGSRAEGDLLIGADGLHSVTRTLIDPAAPRPRHTGQHTVCGYLRDAGSTGAEVAAETYTMILGDRAFFGCTRAPDGEIWWFANIPGAESDRTALQAVGPDEWRDRVAARFPGDATPAAALVRATGDRVIASSAYDLATTPTWYDDTKVVLGDAAHAAAPNAAQGASMAIEDGIVLARCLRDHTEARTAFAAYEELRRERVEKVVATSAGLAARTGPGGPGRPATGPGGGGADGSNWLTDYRIEW